MGYLKVLIVASIWLFLVLFIVLNKKFREDIIFLANLTLFKNIKLKDIATIFSVLVVIFYSYGMLKDAIKNIKEIGENPNKTKELEEYDRNMEIASNQINRYYDILEETKTDINLSKKPYIPTNFKYVDGEWNTGFVIEDENKNQFVWIPCSNEKNNENIPILSRYIFSSNSSSFFSCIEEADIEDFLKSALENGGFYISRYEIGKENDVAVSKAGCDIWTNVTINEAKKISENMYSNINSRLINGYSYDTAVKFIQDEIDEDKISSSSGKTGNKEYKNIYDLVDDLGEWTEEERDSFQIYRKTVIGNEVKYLADRLSESEKYKDENIGFRTIIYK